MHTANEIHADVKGDEPHCRRMRSRKEAEVHLQAETSI
jgi:hypothetical protein